MTPLTDELMWLLFWFIVALTLWWGLPELSRWINGNDKVAQPEKTNKRSH